MTEQKTRIVEWFLQTNSIVTIQHWFKNQYKCKKAPAKNTVKTLVEQFYATGNVKGKKRGRSKPRVCTPDTVETIHASVASSPTRKFVQQLQKMRYCLQEHGAYFILIYTHILTRSMSFSLLTTVCREKWTRFVEEFGDHLQQNPHTLEHIWFTDEAYFYLTGDINRKKRAFLGHPASTSN